MISNFKNKKINRLFLSAILCVFTFLILIKAQEIPLTENLVNDSAPSAQNFHQWGAVSLFHGLPSDTIRAITQDKNGVMWFGTDNGLAKYDGRRVQAVNLQGLNAEKILALKVDKKGTIWIGTDAGAARFVGGQFYPLEETFGKSVVAVSETENGKIVLANDDGQIFQLSQNAENVFVVQTILPHPLFCGINEKSSKLTSLSADGEKYILGTFGHGFIKVENGEEQEIFSRPRPYFITVLQKDNRGNLWFGAQIRRSDGGLYYAEDITRPEKITDETGTVAALAFDANNELWIGTTERGAYHFRGTEKLEHFTFENTAGGLRSNNIYTVFVDRENVVWFGTDKGVCRFDASSPFNQTVSDDKNSNFVRTLYQTKEGRIFAGTNRGLFTFENGNWQSNEIFERKTIYAIIEDSTGNLLIGTSGGLFTSDNRKLADENIRAIENFQGKNYFALFGRGVEQIEGENRTLIFSNDLPTTLFADGEKLWIGTAKDGVFSFDGKAVSVEKSLEKLRGAAVWDIDGNSENGLWFAAERGLFLLRNSELNAVTNVAVRDVFVGKAGDVWGATVGSGLFHLKFDEQFGWMAANFSVEQGLPSPSVFALLPVKNENILIGTTRGTARYSPCRNVPLIIPTRILSQRLHNLNELREGIKLDYPQNTLTVEVTALSSRTFPEQFQYAFTLKNGKNEVIDKKLSHESQFLMENLPPDIYTVEIRAFDKDLQTSAPLTFQFSIGKAPFPWTSTALAILLAIALIALIWAVVERWRITKKNRELAAARFDLANEAERERRRIARDLHDQTLADLRNLMMMMSDKLPAVETTEEKPNFRAEIEVVSNEIRRICEDLSPSVLENVGLTAALEFLLSHTFTQTDKKIAYRFFCEEGLEERLDFPPNAQMQIYRIAQEVLNNIARHSEAKFVELKITGSVEDDFNLKIENDGRDFDAEKAKKGRGLSNIKSRASLIDAEVSWQKSDGKVIFHLFKTKIRKKEFGNN